MNVYFIQVAPVQIPPATSTAHEKKQKKDKKHKNREMTEPTQKTKQTEVRMLEVKTY